MHTHTLHKMAVRWVRVERNEASGKETVDYDENGLRGATMTDPLLALAV